MAVGLPVIGLALIAAKTSFLSGDSSNYKVVYAPPSGWKAVPHGPQTLFLYKNPTSGVLLRGSVNQIIADVNPTPELDTDGIARYYVDRTHDNMPEWTAELGEKVDAHNTSFQIIDREKKDKAVMTAYAVKGNTTLLVSLSGNGGKGKTAVFSTMPEFKTYLSTIALEPTIMDN